MAENLDKALNSAVLVTGRHGRGAFLFGLDLLDCAGVLSAERRGWSNRTVFKGALGTSRCSDLYVVTAGEAGRGKKTARTGKFER